MSASQHRRGLLLASMTVANAMVLVDQTAVPLILPDLMQDLGVGSQEGQWVLSASLLPLAGFLVLGGRLGDLIGRRIVFIIGSALFATASAFAGFAPEFGVLVAFRAVQGLGGALMLPTTIAIVSNAFPASARGRALGTMGGAAAVAGALGPVLGGVLTSTLGWRSVLLLNVPLAALAVVAALLAVPRDARRTGRAHLDFPGALLLSVALVGIVFGLAQSQDWGWSSPGVLLPLVASVVAAVMFVFVERRSAHPLMDFGLLRRHPNYRGATISQAIGGMAEMGLGILFPLLLILNLGLDPGLAGLALIPTTLPMIVLAPLVGRWYDRVGGRIPMATGFAALALAGIALGLGVHGHNYWVILPGLILFGTGLSIVLTVNDPVSLDSVPESDHGQASGVSATAEQFGGALGIAALYLVFHTTYVGYLHWSIDSGPLTDLSASDAAKLRDEIVAAEQTGLDPKTFDPNFTSYLLDARTAAEWGHSLAFFAVALLALAGMFVALRLVRKPVATEIAESVTTD